jgi:long-chain fatty acid transport protein
MNSNNISDFETPFSDFNIAWFNLLGFPAITEHHVTLGLGYQFLFCPYRQQEQVQNL